MQASSSAEVRWFAPGLIPPALNKWFMSDLTGPDPIPETRVDFYLRLSDGDGLGVKARGVENPEGNIEMELNNIETKLRRQELGATRFGEGAEGRLEHWTRWSFKLDGGSDDQPNLNLSPETWVMMKKTRHTRKYEVLSAGGVTPASGRVPEGCNVELVSIELKTGRWWSLCFEAFGSIETVGRNLECATNKVLKETAAPHVLSVDDSYSYPAWIRLNMR